MGSRIDLLEWTVEQSASRSRNSIPSAIFWSGSRAIAERVQTLGGIAVGDPRHVAELTKIRRAPNGCEEVPAMLSRLLEAHETILVDAHDAAAKIAELGDDGSNDLIVSEVIRTGELEAWFLVEHLVDTPLVRVLADARQHNAEPLNLGFFAPNG